MKSFRNQTSDPNKQYQKIYNKSGCQLSEFPIIKLHILQNIQIIDLSNNSICDLTALNIHKSTSQHILSKLKSVDLSNNQITTASALIPLSQAAINLKQLKITANPLTLTLNFLYELVIIFKQITEITHSNTLFIDNDFRIKMIEFQLKGSEFIQKFMKKLYNFTLYSSRIQKNSKFVSKVKDIALRLQSHQYSILQHNSAIFHAIKEFLQNASQLQHTQRYIYESPKVVKDQIDAVSEYKIQKRTKNHLTHYLSQQTSNDQLNGSPHTNQKNIIQFYYNQILKNADIQRKLLEQVQIQQEVNHKLENGQCQKFDRKYLHQLLQEKWQKQTEFTFKQLPETNFHIANSFANSPFKFLHDETSSKRAFTSFFQKKEGEQKYYFGLDRQWTVATHQFITHRLVSLHKRLKNTVISSLEQYGSNNLKDDYFDNIKSTGFVSQQTNLQKYLTFGHHQQKLNEFKIQSDGDYSEDSLDLQGEVLSKSKNKYIISSCLNNLTQIIKKIVFRKIKSSMSIKPDHLFFFLQTIQKIECGLLEHTLRKIGKYSLFIEYISNKMRKLKLQQIFKKWKQLKKRKEKLIKTMLRRKVKKESAFMSIIMTQWRVTASHLKLEENMRKKREMLSVDIPISQMSGILTRSATQQKLGTQRWKSKYHLTNVISRNQL